MNRLKLVVLLLLLVVGCGKVSDPKDSAYVDMATAVVGSATASPSPNGGNGQQYGGMFDTARDIKSIVTDVHRIAADATPVIPALKKAVKVFSDELNKIQDDGTVIAATPMPASVGVPQCSAGSCSCGSCSCGTVSQEGCESGQCEQPRWRLRWR